MNKKNRGFSLLVSVVVSLIMMGISVGIISSINRSLDQVNNIARSNQFFFAAESGYEAALFHHSFRGGALNMKADYSETLADNNAITHGAIGTYTEWEIDGKSEDSWSGEIHENEKITIPLYWDLSSTPKEDPNIQEIGANLTSLKLSFSGNTAFDFGTNQNDVVLFVWSVSRRNASNEIETFNPTTFVDGEPCKNSNAQKSTFYCKSDFKVGGGGSTIGDTRFTGGIIDFNSGQINGKIIPGDAEESISSFMTSNDHTNYEISFQPVLPFTDTDGNKIDHIDFTLTGNNISIPKNIYTVSSKVSGNGLEKTTTINKKEKTSIGAFDYTIFK